ncbi:serine-rich glycoprotein adhesin, partial [Limosilactobacillus mucosae]|uniref:serine-rich glycoprotein adhesin n=1 Tax=Limosilactobacillus mucosae TaxID=97478 RepID=UPI003992DD98
MKSKHVRKNSKVDETERVKLYKTHRGWCSSLSRFWTFLKADSIDEDDETSYEDYLKAIATIGTIAGATMLMPTTAMADSTQLQRTLDSRSSMAIGLSSNTQSESVSGSTDSTNSLDSANSTTTETSTSKSEMAEDSTTSSTSTENSLNSASDSNTLSEGSQTMADSLVNDSKNADGSSTTSEVNNSASENSQAGTAPDYSQTTTSQSVNTLTMASVDPQATAANYLQTVLSQLWVQQSNQVTHPNTILEDKYLNNKNTYNFDWNHIFNDTWGEIFDSFFNHDLDNFYNYIQNCHGNGTLDLASIFGTFSKHLKIDADYRGNLATGDYQGGQEFGTRGDINGNLTNGDVDYIQKISGWLGSNAFSADHNHIVFGQDVDARISQRNGMLYVNNVRMNHVLPGYNADIYQDEAGSNYIDFEQIFKILSSNAQNLSQHKYDTWGVWQGYQNPRIDTNPSNTDYIINVSRVRPDANNRIYVNVPYEYLTGARNTRIVGLTESNFGPVVVINVTNLPEGQTIQINRHLQLQYSDWKNWFDGNWYGSSNVWQGEPNHLLWNFGTTSSTIEFQSPFAGSVLAPNAHVITDVDFAGNIAADTIETRGTFRRWDLNGQLNSTEEERAQTSKSIKASESKSTSIETSQSTSKLLSESKSASEATSKSIKESKAASESTSASIKASESESTSIETSKANSKSLSENESASEVTSKSVKESEIASTSKSVEASQAASVSESESTSKAASESLRASEAASESTSALIKAS